MVWTNRFDCSEAWKVASNGDKSLENRCTARGPNYQIDSCGILMCAFSQKEVFEKIEEKDIGECPNTKAELPVPNMFF